MIQTTALKRITYDSKKYHSSKEKTEAIYKKNNAPDRFNDGSRELVRYPGDTPVLCWINQEADDYEMHWHSAVEIIMPISNSYQVTVNDQALMLNEGDILFIPPGEMHSLAVLEEGQRIILLFDYASLSRIPGFSTLSALFSRELLLTASKEDGIYSDARDILLSMLNLYADDEQFWDLSIIGMFIQFIVLLNLYNQKNNMNLTGLNSNRQKEYLKKFNTVFEFIDQHYAENLDLETVAKYSGFSKFHFSRIFKQFANVSFNEYLNSRRIQAAIALLSSSELTVTEVALMSGFSSISTFNRVFRNIKGCTPTEFKQFQT